MVIEHTYVYRDTSSHQPITLPPLTEEEEILHQFQQEHFLSKLQGGPLPPGFDLAHIRRVLDARCRAGSWAYEMGARYPWMHITGIDNDPTLVAWAQKKLQGMRNVNISRQDRSDLRDTFKSKTFGLVHMRFLTEEVHFQQFPQVVHSLLRHCKIKGLVVWTEPELPLTSSRACDCLESLLLSALSHMGRAFSDGHSPSLGIGAWMHTWLEQGGCKIIYDSASYIDISQGRPAHGTFYRQVCKMAWQIRPMLLQTGLIRPPDLARLHAQLLYELQDRTFCGVWPFRMVVAKKEIHFS